MASRKYDIILETLNRVAKDITDKPGNYMSFLITAANNYKYRFDEQLLIFAQKPNATACAEVDTWNKLGRWVNRGTRGIALIVNRNTPYKLRHVFDISDTNSLHGYNVELWEMKPQYEEAVCDAIQNNFGEVLNKRKIEDFLIATARNAVEDNYTDYFEELLESRKESFLEELDEFNVEVYFKDLLSNSVAYMLLERCGYDVDEYFDIEDFREIANFNTKETISILGTATRDISSMVLLEIEKTVRSIKRQEKTQNRTFEKNDKSIDNSIEEKNAERSDTNDESNNLQTRRGLSNPEFRGASVPEGRQVWNVATHVSSGTQERKVHEAVYDGQTERASGTGGQSSQRNDGELDIEDGEGSASNGEPQSGESNVVGSEDEQHSLGSGGNRTERVDLPLIEGDPFTSKGVEYFHQDYEKCELIKNSPALKDHRIEIAAYFREHKDPKERGDFLMQFFDDKPQEFVLSNGVTAGYKAYKNRIHLWRGSYDSRERDCYVPWRNIAGYIKGMLLMHTWDESLFPSEQEQIERIKAQSEKKLYLPQEAIDYVLGAGSSFSEGKLRIYRQFAKNETADKNIAFLKNEYGQGGRSDAIPGTGYWEQHDAKGISIADHYVTDTKNLLSWSYVNKRIKELIDADRYLSAKEKEAYPAYLKKTEDTNKRWEIAKEFRNIVRDYNDFQEQLGNNDDKLNTYVLVDCSSQFGIGNKHTYTSHANGDFVLPVMREAMNKIIAENTHLTERCKVIEMLQSDVAKPLEPTYDELNPPPEPPKEYRYHLGDTVHIGIDEYEVLAYDDNEVTLYDAKYPIFNKTYSKDEFEKLLVENPFNDHLLVEVAVEPKQVEAVVNKVEESNKEVDTLCAILTALKLDDITIHYENDELVATDDETIWRGKEFYDFLNYDVFTYEDGGTVNGISNELYAEFAELAKKNGTAALDNRYCPTWMEYSSIKADNPESIVLYQVGDFYEILGNDAHIVANELELTLTSRTIRGDERVPMVGFPVHVLEKYVDKLINKKHKLVMASLEDNKRILRALVPVKAEKEIEKPLSEEIAIEENKSEFKFSEPAPVKREKVRPNILYPEIPSSERNNYVITDDNLGVGAPLERYENNVAAIRLLKKLESEKRLATPEEQEVLSRYVGWGGLADCFDEKHSKYLELKSLLDETEYEAARESTLTAFYTPPVVIRSMYKALENMNFKTGNILEPSCGIGNFMGMLPESLGSSKIYGIELDSVSSRIAQQLYQNSSIASRGYEATDLPDSFFDCAIGNVPFGQFKVLDKRYDKHNFLIHDYFFARTLDKVRPGGIVAFITSKGTLDKENPNVRKYIAQRADLIGAIRLPNNTFKSAAGTEVTSDIIFLQKRDRIIDADPDWVHLNTDENGVKMNQYFVDNPDMIMGEMKMVSGPFGPESACVPYEDKDLEEMLLDAIQNIHAEVTEYEFEDFEDDEIDNSIPADPDVRNFSYTVYDGKVYYRENSRMKPIDVSMTAENRIKGLIEIRNCVRTLIEYQTEDYPDYEIKKQQYKLNEIYDRFNKKYGRINSRANSSAFSSDNSYFLLTSLEVLDEEGNFVRKADMFNKRTIKQKVAVTSVDTASEALSVSLAEHTKVDIPFMAELTGKTEDEIIEDLTGVIFKNIGGEDENEYVTADEYLSGNVREKLRIARLKNEADGNDSFAVNVKALEAVQPTDLTASEISVRLGATWLPTDVIDDFMYELFSMAYYMRYNVKTHYSKYTGEWNIQGKSYDRSNVKAYNTYGTSRINGFKILEETLNLRDVRIFDYVEDEKGNKVAVLNKKETAIAQGKQELIKNAFQEWIWNDPERRERLCKMYNEKFNSHRAREYDGDHLNFVGINPEITLRKHQVDAVARGIYGRNELLAHVVGAGKTFTMVAIAQESKRLGLCQKSMFVVPNHLTSQWASEYLQLYPSANILVATKKDFETKNRKKFCGRIATGDYDAVIIGHSQFEKIPMSQERQIQMLNRQMHEILSGIEELKRNRGDNFSIKQLERSKKSIKQKLDKLNDQSRKDDVVTFEELGIDRLFIDEAHYYKNLAAFTKMRNVSGISQTEAMKSSDLYMKCRYLDEITGGKGTCFATGTPISNSMVEMYTMQKYLQYNTLKERDLIHFDAWASNYGETITAIELAPEGTGYRAKTRFAKFYNLPELIMMFKEVADIQTADMLNLPVPKANYHNIVLKPSEHQKEFVESLSERAEKVRNKMVDSSVDNMLLITNDGRKLALDQRLMNDMMPDHENSKTTACANNVYDIWKRTEDKKSTQMIFCDLSTPYGDGKFNVYDDIKKKLIEKGIPEEEIAYIHSANSDVQKKEMFGKVRAGQIRVLLGSTQKMGAGTNVQKKLIALHHLDCPWRPSDLQQREGRIIRQGNDNPEVDIYSYVTENTFDAYLYQLVESKQKFIGQIMTSKSPVRSAEDVDETALSYAEIKALASGNPHIKEKMDLDIEVQKLKLLKANHQSQKFALEDMILKSIPAKIAAIEQRIEGYDKDKIRRNENTKPNEDGFSPMQIDGVVYIEKKEAGTALLEYTKKMKSPEAIRMGSYRGFALEMSFDHFSKEYILTMKGALAHSTPLGTDIFGNILRLDNVLNAFDEKQIHCKEQLERERGELENAKTEVQKPFPREEEYRAKVKRLDELNILLNMDKKENEIVDGEHDEEGKESIPERSSEAR